MLRLLISSRTSPIAPPPPAIPISTVVPSALTAKVWPAPTKLSIVAPIATIPPAVPMPTLPTSKPPIFNLCKRHCGFLDIYIKLKDIMVFAPLVFGAKCGTIGSHKRTSPSFYWDLISSPSIWTTKIVASCFFSSSI